MSKSESTAFEDALEQNGITVDSTMRMGPDTSLMYEHDPENKTRDIATVALLYAKVPWISQNVLSVTPLTSTGRDADRVANYAIERSLANRFNAKELTKKEYVREVLSTWTEYGSDE